ncbi:AzlC family ABC transporter permease [Actinobacillus equuli]|uniref:AzlC family ABC transporter permease n=2 Tax=Actinobacillus equuli TaxID=718 RepID=UPI0024412CC2|nr:AzlC family ABC transporter permease [Actinobacillus equuli]WGE48816.1 AzlC family ABC transporter permease [Actinobacillus equuli subsp. equuli]
MQHHEFFRGVKEVSPMTLGFIPLGLVLGAQASQKGMPFYEIGLLTGLNFAGGSEFAAVNLWTHPLAISVIVAVSMLINSRHIIMGAALSLYMKNIGRLKSLGLLFFMTDEVWAMNLADAQKRPQKAISIPYYMGTAISLYIMWVSSSMLGAYIGPFVGDLEKYGFDMSFTAIFLVMLKGMWKSFSLARPWFISLLVAGLVFHTVEGAWYVLAGALSGILSAYFFAFREDK